MIILGVDPDLHSTAVALLITENNRLQFQAVKVEKTPRTKVGKLAVIDQIIQLRIASGFIQWVPEVLVVESQEIYLGGGGKGAMPGDLISLAQVAGGALSAFTTQHCTQIFLPRPAEWKGQVPKPIHQARTYKEMGWEWEQGDSYAWPKDLRGLNRGDWQHMGDAMGLALWGWKEAKLMKEIHG